MREPERVFGFCAVACSLLVVMRDKNKERLCMLLEDLRLTAAPLIMGAIHMGLATAGGLFERGTLRETLQHTACNEDVIRAIFDHVLDALASAEDPELDGLLDTIETLVLRAQSRQVLQ